MTLARPLSLLAIAALLSLAACGGGGGGGEPVAAAEPNPPAPETPTPDPKPEPMAQTPETEPETPTPEPKPEPTAQMPEPEPETPTPDPDEATRRAALQAGQELAKAAADGALPLPNEHGLRSETIEIASGAYADRGAFRFSCTGSEACAVAVDTASGQARVTAGNVRLARLPAPEMPVAERPNPEMPTPEMPAPSIDWPVWMVMDVARAASLLGGSVLDWGEDKVRAEIYRRFTWYQKGNDWRFGEGIGTDSVGLRGDNTLVVYDRDGNLDYSEEEYSVSDDHALVPNYYTGSVYGMGRCQFGNSVDTCGSDHQSPDTKDKIQYQSVAYSWGNIPVVQARIVNPRRREDHDQFYTLVGGLLEYSDSGLQNRLLDRVTI